MPKNAKPPAKSSSDSDSGPDDRNPPKKSKTTFKNIENNKEAPNQWNLEKMRFVRINEFRGKKMVDIRELYEKDGELLPGRKGISLTPFQWKKLLEVAEEVNKSLE